jgi:hypothetical protein
LTLSSRFHPLSGKYLAHFGAFLDRNFRVYDYYVGVYDAIYHIAEDIKKLQYPHLSQIKIMNRLKTFLGLDKNPEALAAYTLFLNTEFHHLKPKTTDRFSAIYNAFNLKKPDATRYDNAEFKTFLSKLDMKYLDKEENSFIVYAQSDIDNWYKKPMKTIIGRVTALENERDKAGLPHSYGTFTSVAAWASSDLIKEKRGFHFLPMDVPQELLPGEIATDEKNGGLSFGYTALYYTGGEIINGIEGKASYIVGDDTDNFVRMDLTAFKEYDNFIRFGIGPSVFGDMKGSFYHMILKMSKERFMSYRRIKTNVFLMLLVTLPLMADKGSDPKVNHCYVLLLDSLKQKPIKTLYHMNVKRSIQAKRLKKSSIQNLDWLKLNN